MTPHSLFRRTFRHRTSVLSLPLAALCVTGALVAVATSAYAAPTSVSPPAAGAAPSASTAVKITVSKASSGTIGQGFAGFSYEKDRIGAGVFNATDTNLVNLFKLLGPNVIRIGGNLNDIVKWNPSGAGGSASEVAPPDVTKLAGFLSATGWKVIYGINLKINTAANAASEAQFAAHALGSSLMAFEIGNEPNFYTSESGYEASYNSYVKAIRAVVPNAVFDGPGCGDTTAWVSAFGSHEKSNSLQILATHLYIGANTTGTISGMLASTASGRLPSTWAAMQSAQKANGIPQWRMTETNSYYHGGTAGVSDVEAASLWSLNYMYGVASHGGVGVNFHGGSSSQFPLNYTPITYSGITPTGVQGVYYGELLWVMAGTGALHVATVSGGSGVTAWAIGNNVLVDNIGSSAVKATITLPASATAASEYVLTAPSLSSHAVTIGGAAVGVSGSFNPTPTSASVSGTTTTVTIPADSAALVQTH
jgi:hypothetical protein